MNPERRKTARVPVYMKTINETKEFDFAFSYAKDISPGGMALDTKIFLGDEKKLKIGNNLKLKFKIPGGRFYISAIGEVTRIDRSGESSVVIGLKFISLENDFLKEIENFVEESKKGNLVLE